MTAIPLNQITQIASGVGLPDAVPFTTASVVTQVAVQVNGPGGNVCTLQYSLDGTVYFSGSETWVQSGTDQFVNVVVPPTTYFQVTMSASSGSASVWACPVSSLPVSVIEPKPLSYTVNY